METTTSAIKRSAVTVTGLTKVYGTGRAAVRAVDNVDLEVLAGAFTAIMGPSGSGKSTLMHCLAGLDLPDAGTIRIGETVLTQLDDRQLTKLRRDRIGFVFQKYNLLPTLTARENILLPLTLARRQTDAAWFKRLVAAVALADRLEHLPSELSGGQQQRVAIARALITRPTVVFADEPTGNLDSKSGMRFLRLMREAVDQLGQTFVMVTHDPIAASQADRVVFLADGRMVAERERPTPETVLNVMATLDKSGAC